MIRHLPHRFTVLIILAVYRFLRSILGRRHKHSLFYRHLSDTRAVLCMVGNTLRYDIQSARYGFLYIFHTFFFIDIGCGGFFQRFFHLLHHDLIRKRFQPLFLCNRSSCSPLWAIRPVQIVHSHQRVRRLNLCPQFVRQRPLFFNCRQDAFLFLFQIAKVMQTFIQITKYLIIQSAVHFFSITCDKWNGIPLINQGNDRFHLTRFDIQLFLQFFYNIHI